MVNDRQSLDLTTFAAASGGGEVEWRISDGRVPYPESVAEMEARAAAETGFAPPATFVKVLERKSP